MDADRNEYEPEEYDPEAEFRDPDSDTLTIPSVEPPEVETPTVDIPEVEIPQSEVPDELRRGFWSLVLVLNVAILLLALGPMILYFWRSAYHGGVLLIGGLVLLALAYRRYEQLMALDLDTWDDDATDDRDADRTDDPPSEP